MITSSLNPKARPFFPKSSLKHISNIHLNARSIFPKITELRTTYSNLKRQSSGFYVLQLNARSLLPKMSELSELTVDCQPHLVAITETWLDKDVPDGAIVLPGFTVAARVDRANRRGGGVLVLARSDVRFRLREDLRKWDESVWLEIFLGGNGSTSSAQSRGSDANTKAVLVGCYYRPPSSDIEDFATDLESSLDLAGSSSSVLLVGDFNAPCSSWLASDSSGPAGQLLELTTLALGLYQCVSFPTHLNANGSLGSLLDLVLVSDPDLVTSVEALPPLGTSDHLPVLCHLSVCSPRRSSAGRLVWCYEKADFGKLNKSLSQADWSAVFSAHSVDNAWDAWERIFLAHVRKSVPCKKVKHVKPRKPWMTASIECAIKAKHAAFRAYKRCPSDAARRDFVVHRNRVTKLLRKAERAYVSTLHRGLSSSNSSAEPTNFWSFMASVTGKGHRPPIPDLVSPASSRTITSASEKAELLNSFFVQQSSLNTGNSTPDISQLPVNNESFSSLYTTPSDIHDILSKLKVKKAAGIDGITPRLLRVCAKSISSSLSVLFNRSFEEEVFPSAWKRSLVVPSFKRGDSSNPSNYRPIALLPVVGKVCERVVFNRLYRFLSPHLVDHQSGFRKGDGTTLQLLRLIQTWSEAIDSSCYIGAIFFDLQKAYDKVWHAGLLAKLEAAGIHGSALNWFRSYLSGRSQRTKVDGEVSGPAPVLAGVPQGAILSPLLFLVYVNDIPHTSEVNTNLFADDTSAFVSDRCPSQLARRLQSVADSLSTWFRKWFLSVNINKSSTMVFRSRGMKAVPINVSLNGSPLSQVTNLKHLGVTINEFLSWSDHVDVICRKAAKRIGLLRRLRKRLPPLAIRHLFCTSIRPSLEYASLVWSGLSSTDASRLERMQRRAARLFTKSSDLQSTPLDHELLLARAGLASLSTRRRAEQAVLAFKFRSGSLPCHIMDTFGHWLSKPQRSASLRSSSLFRLLRARKSCLKLSPLYLSLSTWNSLPPSVHTSPSPSAVKSLLLSE